MIKMQSIMDGAGGVDKCVLPTTAKDGYRAWISLGYLESTYDVAVLEAFDEDQYGACKALVEKCQHFAACINQVIGDRITPVKQQAGLAKLEKIVAELEGKKETTDGSN